MQNKEEPSNVSESSGESTNAVNSTDEEKQKSFREQAIEVEEGDITRWINVTIKDKTFTIKRTYYAAGISENSIYDKYGDELGTEDEEYKEISAMIIKYLEQKEEHEIDISASVELLERVAEKLERKGIEPASDVEKLRVLANRMKKEERTGYEKEG